MAPYAYLDTWIQDEFSVTVEKFRQCRTYVHAIMPHNMYKSSAIEVVLLLKHRLIILIF